MRNRLVLLTGVLLAGALSGCTAARPSSPAAPTATPTPPYVLAPRPVRPFEIPLRPAAAVLGALRITPIGLSTGSCCVVGTHAEWPAKGQYVYVRVQIENTSRTRQEFDSAGQLLVTADGRAHRIASDAMNIRRQDLKVTLGAGNVLEMDLFYDVPKDARVGAIRLTGRAADGVGGPTGQTLRRDVPLPPTSR